MIKIISGGQTGVDRMALELAKEIGLETGGYVSGIYQTENGQDLSLKEFNLEPTMINNYPHRTKLNIKLAHGTILFGDVNSLGSKLVINYCTDGIHPLIVNPSSEEIRKYIKALIQITKPEQKTIINIAGNRGSKISTDDLNKYREILKQGLNE